MVLEFLIVGITAITLVFQSDAVFSSNVYFADSEPLHMGISDGVTHYVPCACDVKVHAESCGLYSLFKTTNDLKFDKYGWGYFAAEAHYWINGRCVRCDRNSQSKWEIVP